MSQEPRQIPTQELRRIPIHRVATRPTLLLGVDREMLLFLTLVVGILTVWAMNWIAAGIGGAVWVAGLGALRLMAKSDPLLRRVYVRARRYKPYYPARSTPWRKPPSSSWVSVALNALFLRSNDPFTHY